MTRVGEQAPEPEGDHADGGEDGRRNPISRGERATATAPSTTRRNTNARRLAANVSIARAEPDDAPVRDRNERGEARRQARARTGTRRSRSRRRRPRRRTETPHGPVSPQVRRTTRLNAAADAATLITARGGSRRARRAGSRRGCSRRTCTARRTSSSSTARSRAEGRGGAGRRAREVCAGRREPDDQGGERPARVAFLSVSLARRVFKDNAFSETACPGPPDRNPTFRALPRRQG